jgi:hypothetical protein
VFDKLVRFCVFLRGDWVLTGLEIGEDDTRYAQGRDTRPPAYAQHFFYPLNCIYTERQVKNSGTGKSRNLLNMLCAVN